MNDLQRFGRTVKLKAFQPFTTAENALENMNAVSEHVLTDDLKVRLRLCVCGCIGLVCLVWACFWLVCLIWFGVACVHV